MDLAVFLIAILFLFFVKRFTYDTDNIRLVWIAILEMFVDVAALGLLLTVTKVAVQEPSEMTPLAVLSSMFTLYLSALVWKWAAGMVEERNGETKILKKKKLALGIVLLVGFSIVAMVIPFVILGASG